MNVEQLIQSLTLEPHIEGGYFRRTYSAPFRIEGEDRCSLSSIYYLLTRDTPIGHWHRNRSDILHFFHSGSALTYWLISPDGTLEKHLLGPDPSQGHEFQLLVPGGYWKATHLEFGDYGLLSEAVTPGFVFEDMELARREDVLDTLSHAGQMDLLKLLKVN